MVPTEYTRQLRPKEVKAQGHREGPCDVAQGTEGLSVVGWHSTWAIAWLQQLLGELRTVGLTARASPLPMWLTLGGTGRDLHCLGRRHDGFLFNCHSCLTTSCFCDVCFYGSSGGQDLGRDITPSFHHGLRVFWKSRFFPLSCSKMICASDLLYHETFMMQ